MMFDPNVALKQWLGGETSITNLVPANRIVSGDLPQGANPGANENWITFYCRGGLGHPEIKNVIYPSFAITFWGPKDGNVAARAVYLAFRDFAFNAVINPVTEATIMVAEEEVMLQDTSDPATEWFKGVTYWRVTMRANS